MTRLEHVPLRELISDGGRALRHHGAAEVWNLNLDQIESDTGRVLTRQMVAINKLGSSTYPFEAGTVLYSKLRPYLNKVVLADDAGVATTELVPLRCKPEKLLPQYLAHYLRSSEFLGFANTVVAGAKMPRMVMSEFWQHKIPLLPLSEQRRIAAILDQADALRAKRREALAQLDSLTQSIFIEMFGDPVLNPKKWPSAGIESVCDLIVDCVNRTAPVVDSPTPFKMIRTSNVKNGKVNLVDVRCVAEETFERWNRRATPRKNDVLLTREAPVGECGIIDTDDKVFLGQRMMLYRVNEEQMTPQYLLFSFRNQFLQNQFSTNGSGSTVKHLPLPACRSFQLRLPPVEIQRQFSRRVIALEALKVHQMDAASELDTLFASLQHRAFRGEL